MDYREIVAVTGITGLFQLMATKSDGAIVRSLGEKTTRFIPARLHNVTPLESIEVYTINENVRLHEVFQKMKEHPDTVKPDLKKASNQDIKAYFKSIFPEFDEERVYVSDMKKMLKWFEILNDNDLLNFETYNQPVAEGSDENEAKTLQEENQGSVEPASTTEELKPAKKARAKKSAEDPANAEEEKPKKTAKKKKTAEEGAEGEEKPKKTAKKKKDEE
ncbi:MAG: hypothetical protein EOP48_03745 [Sphingobacteriales bacterium]|nr:MAG: hypothetical protein EOP48_03745 [Sphingobacteriales bacterium]